MLRIYCAACSGLCTYRGHGVIFLDGTDPDDEKRFTIAHEIAHFMVDYWHPRQNAINKFGSEIADVVDGVRPPTIAERIHAVLGSTPIGVHTDLMERDRRLDDVSGTLWSIEDRADRIALALLAPPAVVLKEVQFLSSPYGTRDAMLRNLLSEKFGLPAGVAKSYSQLLLTIYGKGHSWLESIGLR
jgi:Zn-dependent peptidase ImmA (M78 family)